MRYEWSTSCAHNSEMWRNLLQAVYWLRTQFDIFSSTIFMFLLIYICSLYRDRLHCYTAEHLWRLLCKKLWIWITFFANLRKIQITLVFLFVSFFLFILRSHFFWKKCSARNSASVDTYVWAWTTTKKKAY